MDHPLIDLINARIARAEADGAFDDLAGSGQPLDLSDTTDDAAMNRILRDNGAVPEVVALSRDISGLRAALRDCSDRTERRKLIAEIALLDTRLEIAKQRG